jgi:hypothetical protein
VSNEATGNLAVTAEGHWYERDEADKLPTLSVEFHARGGSSKTFLLVGNLRIDKAIANGRVLRLNLEGFSPFQFQMTGLTTIDRDTVFGPPIEGTNLDVSFVYPGEPVERITRLAGQFDAVLGGRVKAYTDVKIYDLPKLSETDPDLKAAGVTAVSRKESFSDDLEYVLRAGPRGVITDLKIKDNEGYAFKRGMDRDESAPAGDQFETVFPAEMANLSGQAKRTHSVSFLVHTDLQTITVPFNISDVPVKPLKSQPAPERAQSEVFYGSQKNSTLPETVRVDARFDWKPAPRNFNEAAKPSILTATLELSGSMARDIVLLESAEITSARSDAGDLPPTLPIDSGELWWRKSRFGISHVVQKHGKPVVIEIAFGHPESAGGRCQELAGELSLVTVEERETIIIDEPFKGKEGQIPHPALEQAGITLSYKIGESLLDDGFANVEINVDAADWAKWWDLTLISPGKEIGHFPAYHAFRDDEARKTGRQYSIMKVETSSLPSYKLEIQLNKKVKREKVPFLFQDLPIPAVPTK